MSTTAKGTYILWLHTTQATSIKVGRFGESAFEAGHYAYVGSAFGSGGLAARLKHHRQISARPHWHIDYLRHHWPLQSIWWAADPIRREHVWAEALQQWQGASVPVARLGASDCQCAAHLIQFEHTPSIKAFFTLMQQRFPEHAEIVEESVL